MASYSKIHCSVSAKYDYRTRGAAVNAALLGARIKTGIVCNREGRGIQCATMESPLKRPDFLGTRFKDWPAAAAQLVVLVTSQD